MKAVFDQMRKLRGYVDGNFSGRDWNLATAMVMNGEAAFQIMGDWAKGDRWWLRRVDWLPVCLTPGAGFYTMSTASPCLVLMVLTRRKVRIC